MVDTDHKRTVGKRTLSPVTQMMGFGYDPHLSEGALKPPVSLTSTFVFRKAQEAIWKLNEALSEREEPRSARN